jgi:lipopolysaccharide transport protein LptA
MKSPTSSLALILGATGAALVSMAQTNAPEPAAPGNPPPAAVTNATPEITPTNTASVDPEATEIFADSANFDTKTRVAVYVGNVHVINPQIRLTCGVLTARIPESGKIDSIVAEQDVVIDAVDNKGKPVHATSSRATYKYHVAAGVTNETIELTGGETLPRIEQHGNLLTGESIFWDRINNTVSVNGRMHTVIETTRTAVKTNNPALKPETSEP